MPGHSRGGQASSSVQPVSVCHLCPAQHPCDPRAQLLWGLRLHYLCLIKQTRWISVFLLMGRAGRVVRLFSTVDTSPQQGPQLGLGPLACLPSPFLRLVSVAFCPSQHVPQTVAPPVPFISDSRRECPRAHSLLWVDC